MTHVGTFVILYIVQLFEGPKGNWTVGSTVISWPAVCCCIICLCTTKLTNVKLTTNLTLIDPVKQKKKEMPFCLVFTYCIGYIYFISVLNIQDPGALTCLTLHFIQT